MSSTDCLYNAAAAADSTWGAALSSVAANDDDELSLPRSVINKLIKEAAGRIRVSAEARDLLVACCHEFVRVLSAQANGICESQHKKLIGPDHILSGFFLAIDQLGFALYKAECLEVMNMAQEEAANKRKRMSNRNDTKGYSEAELLRQQQELFAKAREEQSHFTYEDLAKVQEVSRIAYKQEVFRMTQNSPEDNFDENYDAPN